MTTREEFIAEALAWEGTKFHHQAAVKGVGCDCIGLVVGAGRAVGLLTPAMEDTWRRNRGYARTPNPRQMRTALAEVLTEIPFDDVMPGDLAWFRVGADPQHLCIVTRPGWMIHAYAQIGKVVAQPLLGWNNLANPICGWRFPNWSA